MRPRSAALLSAGLVLLVGLPVVLLQHDPARGAPALAADRSAVTTRDAQEFDQLWRDLESLHREADELGPDELRRRAVERTAAFLEFEPESEQRERFEATVDAALADLGEARARMGGVQREAARDPGSEASIQARREGWGRWLEEQRAAADRMLAVLEGGPRHALLAEKRLLWLLQLDFSGRSDRP